MSEPLVKLQMEIMEADLGLDEMIDILREESFVSKEVMVVSIAATLASFGDPGRVNSLAAIALARLVLQGPVHDAVS